MKKCLKRVLICFLLAAFFWCGALIADRQQLRSELVRLHVVANSDSPCDQEIKLQVRDAVIRCVETDLQNIADIGKAKQYLRENLPKIQTAANEALQLAGCDLDAAVTLCREAFDTRVYDTFKLPSGIYDSLRITIGEGEGRNWWCVVFPSLCLPTTTEGFRDVAAGAGFSEALSNTLAGESEYKVRFYFLDALGKLENMLLGE